jgi:hypothetical protein
MATTLSAATLIVTVTEQITLNSASYNQNVVKTISGIRNYSKRVYTVAGSGINKSHAIAEFVPVESGQKYSIEDLRYFRLTNLDDKNNLTISLSSASASAGIECTPKSSIVLFDKRIGSASSQSPIATTKSLDTVYVVNPQVSGVDVEVVVATK